MNNRINLNDSGVLREIVYNELENSESIVSDTSFDLATDVSPAKKTKIEISSIENPIPGPSNAPDVPVIVPVEPVVVLVFLQGQSKVGSSM